MVGDGICALEQEQVGRARQGRGGVISAVSPGSVAARLGLRAGDVLLSVNGHSVRDVIDVRYHAADPYLRLHVGREGKQLDLEAERRYQEHLGLDFAQPIFDRVRHCNNRCEFCFVAQMPPGLRRSLYVRDDDYRLSFLFGSYVTLTNLTETDWARIEEQHLSPLYVSVHATETELRRRLLGHPAAPNVIRQLQRLANMGIAVHTQIVLQPQVNDGRHLDRSLDDLLSLHPSVRSLSVVPVGLTKYHRLDCRPHTEAEMREVLEQVAGWQERLRPRLGVDFVYLADEWYLRLGEQVPPMTRYDGLDLTENGVGLVRHFLDSGAENLRSRLSELEAPTVVTGALFAAVLRAAVAGSDAQVVPVTNRFFGASITVAGLLTAQDVVAALDERPLGEAVVVPPAMFGGPAGQSLDEMWPSDVEQALGAPVIAEGM